MNTPSTSKNRLDPFKRPSSGPAILMSSSSLPPSRVNSVQSLPDLGDNEKPYFISAPSTPQRCSARRTACNIRNIAPIVDLDEIMSFEDRLKQ